MALLSKAHDPPNRLPQTLNPLAEVTVRITVYNPNQGTYDLT